MCCLCIPGFRYQPVASYARCNVPKASSMGCPLDPCRTPVSRWLVESVRLTAVESIFLWYRLFKLVYLVLIRSFSNSDSHKQAHNIFCLRLLPRPYHGQPFGREICWFRGAAFNLMGRVLRGSPGARPGDVRGWQAGLSITMAAAQGQSQQMHRHSSTACISN
jgi:hypothetical protein